jgi:hypothetical protein
MNHKIGDIVSFRYADEVLTGVISDIEKINNSPYYRCYINRNEATYGIYNNSIIESKTRRYTMPDADLKNIIKESEKEKSKLMKEMELIRKKIQAFDDSIEKANIEIELRRQEKVKNSAEKV